MSNVILMLQDLERRKKILKKKHDPWPGRGAYRSFFVFFLFLLLRVVKSQPRMTPTRFRSLNNAVPNPILHWMPSIESTGR